MNSPVSLAINSIEKHQALQYVVENPLTVIMELYKVIREQQLIDGAPPGEENATASLDRWWANTQAIRDLNSLKDYFVMLCEDSPNA